MKNKYIKNNDIYVIVEINLSHDLGVMENTSKEEALVKVAKRIKTLRHEKGISQQDAYNDTGIHFGRIEQGKRDIGYLTLLRICEYFEISINDFFNY